MDIHRVSTVFSLKGRRGQTMVEYILLMSVLVTIGFTVFRSDVFKNFFGEDSEFFGALSGYVEYTYRHGSGQGRTSDMTDGVSNHKSYYSEGKSRFFVATGDAYP